MPWPVESPQGRVPAASRWATGARRRNSKRPGSSTATQPARLVVRSADRASLDVRSRDGPARVRTDRAPAPVPRRAPHPQPELPPRPRAVQASGTHAGRRGPRRRRRTTSPPRRAMRGSAAIDAYSPAYQPLHHCLLRVMADQQLRPVTHAQSNDLPHGANTFPIGGDDQPKWSCCRRQRLPVLPIGWQHDAGPMPGASSATVKTAR